MEIHFRAKGGDPSKGRSVEYVFVEQNEGLEISGGTWPAKYVGDPDDFNDPNSPAYKYRYLNEYLSGFSEEASSEMFTLMGNLLLATSESRGVKLTDTVERYSKPVLDNYMDINDLIDYIHSKDIEYPDKVFEDFDVNDTRKNRDTTYIRSEYVGLIAVAMCCQLMAPIWDEYCESQDGSASDITVSAAFLKTLMRTRFINNRHISKLYEYISCTVEAEDKNYAINACVMGAGKDRIPDIVMGTIMSTKLIMCDILSPAKNHVVVAVNKATIAEVRRLTKDGGRMYARKERRATGEDNEPIPYLEAYATKQKNSDDVYVTNCLFAKNYRRLATYIDPDIDNAMVKTIHESLCKAFKSKPIGQHQLVLCQYITYRSMYNYGPDGRRRRIIMPRTLPEFDREAGLITIAVCAAALITWKFQDLATLLLSTYYIPSMDSGYYSCGTVNDVTTETKNRLAKTHPYTLPPGRKDSPCRNPAIVSIESFTDMVVDAVWNLECDEEVCDLLDFDCGEHLTPADLRNRFAELIILISTDRRAS